MDYKVFLIDSEGNITPIDFSLYQLFPDDNIQTVKQKIIHALDYPVGTDELYLFARFEHKQQILQCFDQTLRQGQSAFTKAEFSQFAVNLEFDSELVKNSQIDSTNKYTYEDIYEIVGNQTTEDLLQPLGKKFEKAFFSYTFPVNPYNTLAQYNYEMDPQNALQTMENNLLISSGKILDNAIFVCYAEDVFHYAKKMRLKTENMAKLYFPQLWQKNIFDKSELLQQRRSLIDSSKKQVSSKILQLYSQIGLFYDVYKMRTGDLPYLKRGISSFSFIFHPDTKILLPLEAIFKNIHSNSDVPFIKYNPGFRRENMYRLYAENITKYGEKIPKLEKNVILHLSREIGKQKQISFFIQDGGTQIFLDIESNGNMNVYGKLEEPVVSIEDLDAVLHRVLEPVFNEIYSFLSRSGYHRASFQSVRDRNCEVVHIKYVWSIKVNHEFSIQKIKSCMKSAFDILQDKIREGILLNYKRVENFHEMNEQELFIRELFERAKSEREMVATLVSEYQLTVEDASSKLAKFLDTYAVMSGSFINKSLSIAERPGFPISIRIPSITENILDADVVVKDNVEYLDILNVYIDTLLRLNISPESTSLPKSEIEELLKTTKNEPVAVAVPVAPVIITATAKPIIQPLKFFEEEEEGEEEEGEAPVEELYEFEGDEEFDSLEKQLEQYQDEMINVEVVDLLENDPVAKQAVEDLDMGSPMESDKESLSKASSSSESEIDESMYEFEGGTKKDEELLSKDIDGLPLRTGNTNLFLDRMKKRDPALFLTKKQDGYSAYSTLCQPRARHPVVLTDEEKKNIDENHPGSYTGAIKYGSTPDKQNWYICPRYWCLKTNTSMTQEEVDSGVCGKVIPEGEKTVKKGHYVYEFTGKNTHYTKGKYIMNSPGFLGKSDLHPNGYKLPCCFKRAWDPKKQQFDEEEDLQDESESKESKSETETPQKSQSMVQTLTSLIRAESNIPTSIKHNPLVLKIEAFPLPQNRMGFLPLSVAQFLRTDNTLTTDKNNKALLRPNTQTLLRYGVNIKKYRNKSFVSCIADVLGEPNVMQMCEKLANAVSLDTFIRLQKGSLTSIFRPKKYDVASIDLSKYDDSQFLKQFDVSIDSHEDFIQDTIASYENFRKFLIDPDTVVAHTYLWDIICSPNPLLFPSGINLAILQMEDNDMTDHVELVCPSSALSSVQYDEKKATLIMIKRGVFYEPIYMFDTGPKDAPNIVRTFFEGRALENIREILQIIKYTTQKFCQPMPSLPKIYEFQQNMGSEEIRMRLLKHKYKISAQVLNYQGKCIGLKIAQLDIVIPCAPSGILPDIPVKLMDDDGLWTSYEKTRNGLQTIATETKGSVLCSPVLKIIEDSMVVGFLTQTNQFVMINPPVAPQIDDGIPLHNSINYHNADLALTHSNSEEIERNYTVKMVSLETQFYAIFRTLARIVLNTHSNRDAKQTIQSIISNIGITYSSKVKMIRQQMHRLLDDYVEFQEFEKATLMAMDENIDCFANNIRSKTDNSAVCFIENGSQHIILPKRHLVSREMNSQLYFDRISDELIRYSRIRSILLDPKLVMNISNNQFLLNDDEILLLQSMLVPEFFEKVPYKAIDNQRITYDMANPVKTQNYTNVVPLDKQGVASEKEEEVDVVELECVKTVDVITGNIATNYWRKVFPKTAKEVSLNTERLCGYYMIQRIYKDNKRSELTMDALKTALQFGYSKLPLEPVLRILVAEGKKQLLKSVLMKKNTLDTIIMTEPYYLTNLDIWILALEFRLPIIFFSSFEMKPFKEPIMWLKLTPSSLNTSHYFVRPPTKMVGYPEYKFLEKSYELEPLGEKFYQNVVVSLNSNGANTMSLEQYVKNF